MYRIRETQVKILYTIESHYYDTAGIRDSYQYSQTIDIADQYTLKKKLMVRVRILYRNKQYFDISDIVITRDHCTLVNG